MLELLVLGATLTLAAWAAGSGVHRRTAAARALNLYAVSRGLLFVPATSKPRGASPRVNGTKDGIVFAIDLYRLHGDIRTRVSTDAPRGRAAVLSVGQRGAFVWEREGVLALGDADFDRAYVVLEGAAEDADVLREVRPLLLKLDELRTGVWLRSDGHKVTISWRGTESDPIVLDAARDALVLIAARHAPHAPYR
ncbi:MAG: hypothetical protein KIT84_29970 [Labilithrix sp.]|nr:hypothetical protein [Labilithrix sp.]MCW5815291.1 hypothetical protein [Labilithrix sp.]